VTLKILLLEDIPGDAELIRRTLEKAGLEFESRREDTREGFVRALTEYHPDIVLADYDLPSFTGAEALEIERRMCPEIPMVIVTGTLGDESAVEILKSGAKDYVLKDNLERLPHAVRRALSDEQGIRARKASERAMRESEGRLRALTENSSDIITVIAPDGVVLFDSPSITMLLGYEHGELLGSNAFELVHPDDRARTREVLASLLANPGVLHTVEHRLHHKRGQWRVYETKGVYLAEESGIQGIVINARDITERKQSEHALQKVNRALKVLSACNQQLIHARDEPALLQGVCTAIREIGGFRRVWVGYADDENAKSLHIVAQSVLQGGAFEDIALMVDNSHDLENAGQAIRSGEVQITRLGTHGAASSQWCTESGARDCMSCIAIPFYIAEQVRGALCIYSNVADFFDAEEVSLLRELADDLAFGIASLRIHDERDRIAEEHRHYQTTLRKSLEESIQAIAYTVEMRDPYTAGHQRRVAQLSTAMAREMGLSEDRIHGLNLAATIHDLGKIHIPAEILSRPGKLSIAEFELIKSHPTDGHNIIKDVQFPWPIARIVLQHHEHLDGSGYPNGLKSEQLLTESKILIVADVVEAMSSHRPYRPALGIDAGLEEINAHRGVWFDADAVDACGRLFREGRFQWRVR
jgi:PAS domain S-box-containing protein